jgi:hydrogenase small subunit
MNAARPNQILLTFLTRPWRKMLSTLVASATTLETIDERLLRCGISRRSFLVFCSTLMIAAPYGLAITDKLTPEEVAAGLGKSLARPSSGFIFRIAPGCTESLLQTSHPNFGDLILNVISLEYHETLMAGSGLQARQALDEAVKSTPANSFSLSKDRSRPRIREST